MKTCVQLDDGGAVESAEAELLYATDLVALVPAHAVEFLVSQLLRALGAPTNSLYTGALAYAPIRAASLALSNPGMCLLYLSDYWGERGIMQVKYYVMAAGHQASVAAFYRAGRQWIELNQPGGRAKLKKRKKSNREVSAEKD